MNTLNNTIYLAEKHKRYADKLGRPEYRIWYNTR